MSLRLNDITDELVLENLADDDDSLRRFAEPLATAPAREHLHYWKYLGETSRSVALACYQQQRESEVVMRHASRAAEAFSRYYALRDTPEAGVNEWAFNANLSFAAAFGDASVRARLSTIRSQQYETARPETASLRGYLVALRAALSGSTDHAALQAAESACGSRRASRDETLYLAPLVYALRSIESRNAGGLDAALTRTIDQRIRDAKGEMRVDIRAFMILDALVLVRFALECGVPITADSPYLPVSIVEQAWRTTSST